jgi:homoserine O-succinyltransferase
VPVYLETPALLPSKPADTPWAGSVSRFDREEHSDACLHIGLVNNMPLAAMKATESQFLSLLYAASASMCVHVSLYTLPGVHHSGIESGDRSDYSSLHTLWERSLDGLIVTGAEPVTPTLVEEPYWPALVELVGWAAEHTTSTIWSCLAAHAAVLAQDGIPRIRAGRKQFGIFRCAHAGTHSLLRDLPAAFTVPHSRWNGINEEALTDAGYHTLSRAEGIGVDMFVKQYRSLFVCLQGHPEYSTDTLLREYRRDVTRYVRGESETKPQLPLRYFDPLSESLLAQLWDDGRMLRSEESLSTLFSILVKAHVADDWHTTACSLYKNWLSHLYLEKAKQTSGDAFPLIATGNTNRTPSNAG